MKKSSGRRRPSTKNTQFLLFLSLLLIFAVALLLAVGPSSAKLVSTGYVPQGSNPLLYQPGVDPIVHLDQSTFVDTVFEAGRSNAFVVEFYADWCGHCRAFAPHFRQFSSLTKRWEEVVKIGAVNCADSFNSQVCRANGVGYFPLIKYFPRKAASFEDGLLMESAPSGTGLRDVLANKVLNEFKRFSYADWPDLRPLEVHAQTRFENLWDGVPSSTDFLLIVFEPSKVSAGSLAGVHAILDLWPSRAQVRVRRAPSSSPLVQMLGISKFPYIALFKRDDQQSIFMDELRGPSSLDEAMQRVQPGGQFVSLDSEQRLNSNLLSPTTKKAVIDCEQSPERCKPLYFVSETDLLKAMRMALLDEVTRLGVPIEGDRFKKLYAFVSLLHEHFPTKTFDAGGTETTRKSRHVFRRAAQNSALSSLKNSERARLVFAHLRQLLEGKAVARISAEEWRNQFENVERIYGFPFAQNASWQHCAGSSPEFRGYTCGLWSTFHTLTVHAYIDSMQSRVSLDPMLPLRAIQGWVATFFGCEHCRQHFLHMTMEKFPMNEQRIQRLQDMFMYLWRAHNIVNNRLKGTNTEDPQFSKYQFPPLFLCPTCHAGGHFSRRQTRNFLLRYYGAIRPFHRTHTITAANIGANRNDSSNNKGRS